MALYDKFAMKCHKNNVCFVEDRLFTICVPRTSKLPSALSQTLLYYNYVLFIILKILYIASEIMAISWRHIVIMFTKWRFKILRRLYMEMGRGVYAEWEWEYFAKKSGNVNLRVYIHVYTFTLRQIMTRYDFVEAMQVIWEMLEPIPTLTNLTFAKLFHVNWVLSVIRSLSNCMSIGPTNYLITFWG